MIKVGDPPSAKVFPQGNPHYTADKLTLVMLSRHTHTAKSNMSDNKQ